MKKKNTVYLLLLLILFKSCEIEQNKIEINYAANPYQIDTKGNYLYKDKIALLWWDGNSEKIGLFNTNTDSLVVIGTVGDLQWWQQQCIVKDDTLYTFGFNESDESHNMLYINDLNTGTLISKTKMSSDLTNLTIAGRYNDKILLLWWDGSSENYGVLNTDPYTITKIGTVGDLQWWQQQCIVKDDALYTFGFNESDESHNMLYINDLNTGTLISKTKMSSDLTNLTIAGRYNDKILLLWWDGASENFGVFNTDSNTITKIGTVGDLQWWQRLCFVNENTLYTFGYNESDESHNMLYKNDLNTGSLESKSNYKSNLINLTISKNK